jgi:hypothetical protein
VRFEQPYKHLVLYIERLVLSKLPDAQASVTIAITCAVLYLKSTPELALSRSAAAAWRMSADSPPPFMFAAWSSFGLPVAGTPNAVANRSVGS